MNNNRKPKIKRINLKELEREELVDYEIAARLLGLSSRTVQDKARRRELPIYKIGRAVRFRVGDMLDWREQRRLESIDN